MNYTAGIDPGLSGAITVLRSEHSGRKPRIAFIGPIEGKDRDALFDELRTISLFDNVEFALERLPGCVGDGTETPGAAMAKLHRHAGLIEGFLCGIDHTPKLYAPQSWQHRWKKRLPVKKLLPGSPARQQTLWKSALWDIAQGYFPALKVNKTWADSVLIALNHHLNRTT